MITCVCVCFCLSSQDAIVTTSTKESHTWKQESWVLLNYKQKTFLMRKPKLGEEEMVKIIKEKSLAKRGKGVRKGKGY